MSRKPRKISNTGIYHVVIKAVNGSLLFYDDKDYLKYIDLLKTYKQICGFQLYAYCLMANHVHILIKTSVDDISSVFRKINTKYAQWLNFKYERKGYVQKDRFFSNSIEDETYFYATLRYIHQNPMRAGLEAYPGERYFWSSIIDYIHGINDLVSTNIIINKYGGINQFLKFQNVEDKNYNKYYPLKRKFSDQEAAVFIEKNLTDALHASKEHYTMEDIKKYVLFFYNQGISFTQIDRLTGFPKRTIRKIINEFNDENSTK